MPLPGMMCVAVHLLSPVNQCWTVPDCPSALRQWLVNYWAWEKRSKLTHEDGVATACVQYRYIDQLSDSFHEEISK